MSVTIRLRRVGRKKQPSYRVVVTEKSSPRDGAYLDTVGFYNPRRERAELRLDLEKVEAWVGRGALMSDTVASLVRKARKGGDSKVELKPLKGEPPPAPPVVEAPQAKVKAKAGSRGRGTTAMTPQEKAEVAAEPDPARGESAESEAKKESAE
jgi:small subunit ribosomal protein S16